MLKINLCYTNSNVIGSDDTLSVSRLHPHRRHSGPINFVSLVAVRFFLKFS